MSNQQDDALQTNNNTFAFDPTKLSFMTAEMKWHFRTSGCEGVESVDFHPSFGDDNDNGEVIGRLCTAGLDGVVRIWELSRNAEEHIQRAFVEKGSHDYSFIRVAGSLERTSEGEAEFSCFTCRWSPCGQLIASCYSDGVVIVWCYDPIESAKLSEDEAHEKGRDKWRIINKFRGPQSDISEIVDVCFTRDSSQVCFVCNSGVMMMFPIGKKHAIQTYSNPEDHSPSALGLAMDPLGLLFGTTGSDTRLRFYDTTPLIQRANGDKIENWNLAKGAQHGPGVEECAQCLDAILGHAGGPFFRRSSWSPDGGMAAFPFGRVYSYPSQAMRDQQQMNNTNNNEETKNNNNDDVEVGSDDDQPQQRNNNTNTNTNNDNNKNVDELLLSTYPGSTANAINPPTGSDCVTSSVIFVTRSKLNRVAAALTIKDTTAIAGCRFAPKVFEAFEEDTKDANRAKSKGAWGPLLYRYALAVWTSGTVIVFTSDSSARHSSFSNLHYAKINDVAWTPRCKILAVASEDQTVSLISLADTLGSQTVPLMTIRQRIPPHLCPPLLLIATTMIKTMEECAEKNEAATLETVNQTVNKVVNKKVVVRRVRTANNNNNNTTNANTTANTTTTANQDGQAAPPQPAPETANESDLLAALEN